MKKSFFVLLGILVTTWIVAFSMTGQEVINQVINQNSDFKNQKIEMNMKISENGQVDSYTLFIYIYNKSTDQKYALIRFVSPESIKGMSFLSLGSNDEYLYMPAYHRIERIAGSSKNSKFAGSDFTFNDLSLLYAQEQNANYDLISKSATCYILEVTSKPNTNFEYSKLIMTIEIDHMLPQKVEFYKGTSLYKTMICKDLTNFDGHWSYKQIDMKMADGSSETRLEIENIQSNIDIPESFFSVRTLFEPNLNY
ncbi:outer membrane lipoprotein-sorting protein [Athalassotoga saccharophila]|uniref:outer membrane lipoprotein-sorting protein n=1 Tax=Athalassotoga saccharophila TaxID=1441386 RepID=UPI00137AD436|nr:outer membrane lipoprotein-sorting protein [Athalassotoga saccharophila]BBJ28632.1 hypothetical protein ATHSA_1551 [Athalassotoga saccharophila]